MGEQIAGWYPDPSGDVSKLRYWDGSQWTNEYCAAPTAQPIAQQAAQPAAQPTAVYVEETFVSASVAEAPTPTYGTPAPAQPYGQSQPVAQPFAQPFAQPQPVYVQPTAQPSNGMAIASLVLGILGICSGTVAPSIAAIILAVLGKKKPGGQGMATAGLIMGIIGLIIWIIIWAVFGLAIMAALDAGPSSYYSYRY